MSNADHTLDCEYPEGCTCGASVPAAPLTPDKCPHGSFRHVCSECLAVTVTAPTLPIGSGAPFNGASGAAPLTGVVGEDAEVEEALRDAEDPSRSLTPGRRLAKILARAYRAIRAENDGRGKLMQDLIDYIDRRDRVKDWARVECGGEPFKGHEGFQCAYHAAKSALPVPPAINNKENP